MGKGRAPCCDKTKVKRGPWSPEEDLKLISFVQQHGHANWRALPAQAGLLRCGKSCRLRWINYLRPDVKRGSLTPEEEETIIKLHHTYGNKWSKIASEIPGRTDNEIKNVFNTHLKKRLMHHQYEDNLNSYSSTPTTSSSSPVLKKKRKKSPKTPILTTTPPVLTQPSSPTEMSSLSSSSSPIIHHSKNPTTNMITTHTPAHSLQQQQITTLNSFSHNYYCDNNTDQIMKHTAAAASSIQMTPLSPSRSCVSNSSIQNQLLSNVLPVDYNTVCDAAIHPQETSDSIDSDQMGYFNDMKFWDDLQLDNLCTIQAMGEDQQLDMLNGEDKYGSCIGGGEGINHNNNNNNNNNAGDQLRDWLTYVENVLGLDEDN